MKAGVYFTCIDASNYSRAIMQPDGTWKIETAGVCLPPRFVGERNWYELLLKYMQHVIDEESISYTNNLPRSAGGPDTVFFTEDEIRELQAAAAECRRREALL